MKIADILGEASIPEILRLCREYKWIFDRDFVMDRSHPVVLPEAFNVLVFFDQTHASKLLGTSIPNLWKNQNSAR